MQGNVVADFAEHGIWAESSSVLTFDNNWVLRVIPDAKEEP